MFVDKIYAYWEQHDPTLGFVPRGTIVSVVDEIVFVLWFDP